MNDPVDKVFDTTYKVYQHSVQLAHNSINFIKDKSGQLETNVSSVINNYPLRMKAVPVVEVQEPSVFVKNRSWVLLAMLGGPLLLAILMRGSQGRRQKLRRANKLLNGARYETILIIGSPLNQSIQRLVSDLNQRGFIIYITVSSEAELKVVELEDSIDIRPLLISYESIKTVKEAMKNFELILNTPVLPFPQGDEHLLNLKSVLVIPDYNHFPKGLLEEIPVLEWERVLNNQFMKIINLCYCGLLKIIRKSNQQKSKIERINRVFSDDEDDEEEKENTVNIGGDTKLIFINFVNTVNNSLKNFHFAEQISILLKEKLFNSIYNDIQYMNQFDIPQRPNLFAQWFYPRLKSPHYINISQLVINYSPSSATRGNESVYLTSPLESQYKLTRFSSLGFFRRYWYKIYDLIFSGKSHKLSSTRLHHKIFDMVYSTKALSKTQFISSRGFLYDLLKQLTN